MLIINIHRMFINETNPNSIIIEEFVKTNVPKPKAVVALVKKVAFPTFWIILSKEDKILFKNKLKLIYSANSASIGNRGKDKNL